MRTEIYIAVAEFLLGAILALVAIRVGPISRITLAALVVSGVWGWGVALNRALGWAARRLEERKWA